MLHFLSYLDTEMAQLKSSLMEGNDMFYHGCRYSSSSRGQNISIYVINQVTLKYSNSSKRKVKM